MKNATKQLCINAMGLALFVVLTLCLQVPVFENYYLCLGYIVMMVYCYNFGPISGTIVGTLGVVLYCVLTNGLRGMPGWALGNVVIGSMVGIACKVSANCKKRFIRMLIVAAAIIVSTAIGILCVKSFVEYILYAEPMVLRITKNVYAFVADIVVMIMAVPICEALYPTIKKILT